MYAFDNNPTFRTGNFLLHVGHFAMWFYFNHELNRDSDEVVFTFLKIRRCVIHIKTVTNNKRIGSPKYT